MAESVMVNRYVDEEGVVFLELAGLKLWMEARLAARQELRSERISAGRVDPGPLPVRDLLDSLSKVPDGRS